MPIGVFCVLQITLMSIKKLKNVDLYSEFSIEK